MKIEYRTPPGAGNYSVLADEGPPAIATDDRITGWQPRLQKSPQNDPLYGKLAPFVQDIGNGLFTFSWGVNRTHGTPDQAALFVLNHLLALNVVANFDLKFTIGAQVFFALNCALTEFTPDPHSDQSTFIRYAFVGGSYST